MNAIIVKIFSPDVNFVTFCRMDVHEIIAVTKNMNVFKI